MTLFWLAWLARRRKEVGANWKKLPEDLERGLSRIVTDDTYAGTLGHVVLSSQLSDEAWTKEKIVPLFDWDRSKEQAIQSFSGFFTWGQQSEKLLLVLLPLYEKIFRHTTELAEVRERFTEYLAGLAMWGNIAPLNQGWLTRFVSSAEDVDRQRWAAQIQRILRGASGAVRDGNWYRWMKDYWVARRHVSRAASPPQTSDLTLALYRMRALDRTSPRPPGGFVALGWACSISIDCVLDASLVPEVSGELV